MKKKLLEKDGFYLALFICVCLVAVGGVWFTKNNVDNLASNTVNKNDEDELRVIEKEKDDAIPTTTDSDQNLEKAKEKAESKNQNSKINFIGNKVVREYSEKVPSYSKTLDVWEIHKGIDVSANKGQEVKSLLSGTVLEVFKDDKYGMSVKVKCDNDTTVIYSNLDENILVKKDDKVKEGQVLGSVGNTTSEKNTTNVESQDGIHVHLEAYKGKQSIDPMSLIK